MWLATVWLILLTLGMSNYGWQPSMLIILGTMVGHHLAECQRNSKLAPPPTKKSSDPIHVDLPSMEESK